MAYSFEEKYSFHIAIVILEDPRNINKSLTLDNRKVIDEKFSSLLKNELGKIKQLDITYNFSYTFAWINISSGIDKDVEHLCCDIFSKSNIIFLLPYEYLDWSKNYWNAAMLIFRLINLWAESRHIPLLSWIPELKREFDEKSIPYLVSLHPMMDSYSSAIASFISRTKRPAFFEITCGEISEVMKKFSLAVSKKLNFIENVQFTHIEISSDDIIEIIKQLVNLIHSSANLAIFVNCESDQWLKVLSTIEILNITGEKYQWFLTSSMLDFNETLVIPPNSISMRFPGGNFDLDKKLEIALDTLLSALLELKFKILKSLPVLTHCFDSQPWIDGTLLYKTLLTTQPPDQLEIMRYRNHTWKKEGGWSEYKEVYLYKRWQNHTLSMDQVKDDPVHFHHLQIVTKEEEPFIMFKNNKGGKECIVGTLCFKYSQNPKAQTHFCCTGFLVDLLLLLSKELYFSFDLYRVRDGLWGSINESGQWVGIIGELMRGDADIALTSLKIDKARQQVVDFSAPFMETGISILVTKKPGTVSASAFLKPFDVSAWLMICFCMVPITALVILIFEWLSPSGYNRDYATAHKNITFCGIIWMVWDLLLNNLVPSEHPRGMTSRFLANVWACFALVFLSSYTANLAAYMIQEVQVEEISGLNDPKFSNPYSIHPPFKFGSVGAGSTDLLIKTQYPVMHSYMHKYRQRNLREAVNSLRNGSLDAFIYDAAALEFKVGSDQDCLLETVGKLSAMTGYGVAFNKGSPWKEPFDKALLKFHDSGDIYYLRNIWFVGACRKQKRTESLSHPLGIPNVLGTLYLLLAGLLISIFIFTCEHIFHRKQTKSASSIKVLRPDMLSLVSVGLMRSFDASYERACKPRKSIIPCDNIACSERAKENQEYISKLEETIHSIIAERLEEDKSQYHK